jgi:hypothetical protein
MAMCVAARLTAFAQEPNPVPAPVQAQGVEGYQLEISVQKESLSPLEPIVLNITLKNIGKEDVRIASITPIADYQIEVRPMRPDLINGQQVSKENAPLTLEGRRLMQGAMQASGRTELLRRGESVTVSLESLNRIFDMTLDGEYKIVVRRKVPQRSDTPKLVEVTSNPIEIKVK